MKTVNIHNEFLNVTISSIGAELMSIRDKDNIERLWQGDPTYWTGRAPILFPVAGGLIEDSYILDGKKYSMPKHGFVRKLEWDVVSHDENLATFVIAKQDPGFPFDYALSARYTLRNSSLNVEYIVTNLGDETFWYGIGAHEAYLTPEGIEQYEIVFDKTERLDSSILEGNFILHDVTTIAENTNILKLKYDYFAKDALVFRSLKSRSVTLQSLVHNRGITVDFPDHDVLMFWTKPGAPYICIEPWINAPDFIDHDMNIERKPGCVKLMSGQTRTHTHVITIK